MISIKKKCGKEERVSAGQWVCFIGVALYLSFLWPFEKLHNLTGP